jgi:hypothetical protein
LGHLSEIVIVDILILVLILVRQLLQAFDHLLRRLPD